MWTAVLSPVRPQDITGEQAFAGLAIAAVMTWLLLVASGVGLERWLRRRGGVQPAASRFVIGTVLSLVAVAFGFLLADTYAILIPDG